MTKLITRSGFHHNEARHEKRGLSFCPQNNKKLFKSPVNGTVPFLVLSRAIRLPSSTQPPLQCQLGLCVHTKAPLHKFCLRQILQCGQCYRDGMSGTNMQRFHFTTLGMTHLEEIVLNLLFLPNNLIKVLLCSLLSQCKPSVSPCHQPCTWEAERQGKKKEHELGRGRSGFQTWL